MSKPKTYALENGGTVEVTILGAGFHRMADIHLRTEDGRTVATLWRPLWEAEEMVAGLEEVTPTSTAPTAPAFTK